MQQNVGKQDTQDVADAPDTEHTARLHERAAEHFDPAFYLSAYPDVGQIGIDPLDHFLKFGWAEERRPNAWFDPKKYARQIVDLDTKTENVFLHLCNVTLQSNEDPQVMYSKLVSDAVTHRPRNAAPADQPITLKVSKPDAKALQQAAALFDVDYYLAHNPDVAETGVDPLVHFMTIGWIEGRDPSPEFSVNYYLRNNKDVAASGTNPLAHHLKVRDRETWRASETVEGAKMLAVFEEGGALHTHLHEAMELDPMVGFPRGRIRHSSPTRTLGPLTDMVEDLRRQLAAQRYDYVVAVPHIRMSGAARVAAIFTKILSNLTSQGNVLVLITDSSERPYAHWFPPEIRLLDISDHVAKLDKGYRFHLLYDLLRGVGCKTLVNVNSRLTWDMTCDFGRQMSQEFRVLTYFFTWDETKDGRRGGYPIQWLRETADAHHTLITDTQALASDLTLRMGYEDGRVRALYTPVEHPTAQAKPVAPGAQPRFLWAGRFDRQKRVDVLVEIARANPDILFDVYGKAVLDEGGLDSFDPPPNINALGTYDQLEDVFKRTYHGFVYTAQWDGLPTILLDMGLAGLPIVGPRVGGIAELIDGTTGWLIDDFTDVAGYSEALREMIADPAAAQTRVAALKQRIATQFSEARYVKQLEEILNVGNT